MENFLNKKRFKMNNLCTKDGCVTNANPLVVNIFYGITLATAFVGLVKSLKTVPKRRSKKR